jgi:hypothetical protein
LQTEAEDYAKFVTGIASAYFLRAMKTNFLPAGSVVPAQPVKLQSRRSAPTGFTKSSMTATELPCAGTVPQCGFRNAYDWTARLAAIGAAADLIKDLTTQSHICGPEGCAGATAAQHQGRHSA